jgi:outer membrane protein TolC
MKQPLTLLAVLLTVLLSPSVGAQTTRLDADTSARMAIGASALTIAAADRVEASVSAVEAADAARWPVLSANADLVQRSAVPEFGVPTDDPNEPVFILFPNIENTYSADLRLSQPIYTGGAIAATREAARFDQSAATSTSSMTALDLAYSARSLYWSAVAATASVQVAEAQLTRTRRLLDDARALRDAGMAVNADVFAAEARAASADVDVIRASTEMEKALASLRSLLGLDPNTALVLADTQTDRVPREPARLEDLQTVAIENRPELLVTDARIQGLGARAKATNAARKPTVGLSAHWKYAHPNERYLPPVDEANDSWGISLGASWQFFDGSRTKAQVAEVHAEQRALQSDRAELERRILLEVESARLELRSAIEAVNAADASAAAAEAWEEASSERYAAGLAMLSELLDAQADLTAAEVAQVRTRVSAWMAEATLRRAVGQ